MARKKGLATSFGVWGSEFAVRNTSDLLLTAPAVQGTANCERMHPAGLEPATCEPKSHTLSNRTTVGGMRETRMVRKRGMAHRSPRAICVWSLGFGVHGSEFTVRGSPRVRGLEFDVWEIDFVRSLEISRAKAWGGFDFTDRC
ncbi:MAG TPA: hypothetical protein VNY04_07940 [Chthoniobacterales bacterium]|nr:hypothetical protein [Chthoniobacterales bacterium]